MLLYIIHTLHLPPPHPLHTCAIPSAVLAALGQHVVGPHQQISQNVGVGMVNCNERSTSTWSEVLRGRFSLTLQPKT